ncbi:MAG: DUF4252 domain-containing protein [Bacteroidetes bacterium]|nr:DUF4252 domain-containing protein [Bacteroidota bacterium]
MKKQIGKIIVITMMVLPVSLFAQSDFNKLYEKYAGQDGFTCINISPDMFKFLSSIDMNDSSSDAKQAQNVMQQLEGLKMLVYEKSKGKSDFDFFKEINKSLSLKNYTELMSVKESDSDIRFLVKKAGKNSISELLMIVKDENEVLIMSMTGNIDMNTISDISNSLDMKGLENLEKLDN